MEPLRRPLRTLKEATQASQLHEFFPAFFDPGYCLL
jgi:hypothetical protein